MPVLNGFQATVEIRRCTVPGRHKTPIVAMSANAMNGDRERCLEVGMDDYLTKPLRLDELAGAVERWCATQIDKPNAGTSCLDLSLLARNS
jgi:CheY-like chemotaxis protein